MQPQGKKYDESQNGLNLVSSNYQLTSADYIPQDDDSIERITTLGVRLTNPYLVPNMQQAYTNLGLSSSLLLSLISFESL